MNLTDFIQSQLGPVQAAQLGARIGLAPQQAETALSALWPLQLDALASRTQNTSLGTAGTQQLLDMTSSLPSGSVAEMLERPSTLDMLETRGRELTPLLLGENASTISSQVASITETPPEAVPRLGHLTLPLLLGLIAQFHRSNTASAGVAGLGAALSEIRPQLTALLPAALIPLLGRLTAPAALTPPVIAAPSPTPAVPTPSLNTPGARVTTTPPPAPERRGSGWLWAIPLALLLLVGGCFLANQNRMAAGTATGEGAAMTDSALTITDPAAGATLPAAAFTMRGGGKTGQIVKVMEGGQELSTATVGEGGTWSAELPAPSAGAHNYEVQADGAQPAQLALTIGAAGAADSTGIAGTEASAGALAITAPAEGGSVPDGAFDLKGMGTAGQSVDVLEDGASIGTATVGADGTWTLNVPAPTPGAHQYEIRSQGQSAGRAVTVGAASASTDASACAEAFSISLKDGQSVGAPFRFGGQGAAGGYNVTVKRGERTVGTKALPLGATCGWSYRSNPGRGEVTYVVRPGQDANAEPLSTLTLDVQ
ncbi:DUF937 domain-containing protein [Deinococcus sp.]|uniref:DUF937 domain-containing protein n=1 Tax=Deinococcus sp. TaxID=47478 RepID=UPI003B591F1B